jgi:hypothetical protein
MKGDTMKRIGVLVLTFAVLFLLTSVLLYSGDEKSVKKEAQVKTQKTCQGICAHDSVKCALEKGSAACLEKHKTNGCKDKCNPEMCSKECKDKCAQSDCSKCDMSKCDMSKCTNHKSDPDKK